MLRNSQVARLCCLNNHTLHAGTSTLVSVPWVRMPEAFNARLPVSVKFFYCDSDIFAKKKENDNNNSSI